MFAAFYGMRRSEALGIRKAVIDRKKKTITVCHTIIEVNLMGEHKIIRKDRTKNKKSFRTYPLIPQIEMFLDWELQQQEKQRELMGSCYYMGDQEYICLDANGHLLRPDYVTSKFSELVKKRGLKKITFHGLRHCALPGFVDSKNEEKTERNAGYLVVSHSGGGMLRQGTRKGIRRTPANRGMRAHRIVKSLDISEDVCHGLCP